MNRLLYLSTLTLFTALIPGLRCLYRRRRWSAGLFFVATIAVFVALLSAYRGRALVSAEVLLFSVVFVYGAHFVLLSASLAAAAERRNRSRGTQEGRPQFPFEELMPISTLSRVSASRLSITHSEFLEQA
jgi:hypothetical protein